MKKEGLTYIWKVPRYLPYVQPDLTSDIVSKSEKELGIKLPKEYLNLLKIQNGGYIRYSLKDSPHSQIHGLGPYYPSLKALEWLGEDDALSFEINGLFPFDGDGHWYICLDYRQNKDLPVITYIDTELNFEKKISNSFNEYLSLLEFYTEEDGTYVIGTEKTIDEIVLQISRLTNMEFNAPKTRDGRLSYSGKFGDSWIIISPNEVSAALIRPGEKRYEELKHEMDKKASQFPEFNEKYLLLKSFDEQASKTLVDILKRQQIPIKPLRYYFNDKK